MKENSKKKIFDLEERTAKFGESVIQFCKSAISNEITRPLLTQLIRAATSIGANYLEAEDSESKKDFIHKISICKKESKETKHWLRMVATAQSDKKEEARKLWQETQELNLIFAAIVRNKQEK